MRFCSLCAAPLEERIPPGEDRLRKVCTACGEVHYLNPRVVVGCVIEDGERLLLCRRAIEPALGAWTPPAGFLEIGEGAAAGAARETMEEAGADVEITAPLGWFDQPHIGQAYQLFRARMRRPDFEAGPESLEVAWVERADIPWEQLAFPVIDFALRAWVHDLEEGQQRLHTGVLHWSGHGSRFDARNYELRERMDLPLRLT